MGSRIRQFALGLILAATQATATPLGLGTASATPSWQLLSGYASPFGDGIYDPIGRRIVLFTGSSIYQLDLDAPDQSWWPVPSIGAPSCAPDFWNNARVIYDAANHRAIVHRTNVCGGSSLLSEVWEVTLGATPVWTQLTPSGTPPDGHMPATIYDPVGKRMIAFGDWDYSSNRVWALSLDGAPVWTELLPTGTPPVASRYFSVAYDPTGHRMLVGGIGSSPYQTWALSLGGAPAWTQLSTTSPLTYPIYTIDMIVDPVSNDLVMFGGEVLDLTTNVWGHLGVPGNYCNRGEAIHDPVDGSIYKWGGIAGVGVYCNQTWKLTLGASPTEQQVALFSALGSEAAFIHDPVRNQVIGFSGWVFGDEFGHRWTVDETWSWVDSFVPGWTDMAPLGSPPLSRRGVSLIYDPIADAIWMFGGENLYGSSFPPGIELNDVWRLSPTGPVTWTEVHPAGTLPGPRRGHSAVYDPVGHRMVVFGGLSYYEGLIGGALTLTMGGTPSWSSVVTTGPSPSPRWNHQAVWDPVGSRMLVIGGSGSGTTYRDLWALSLSGSPKWTPLSPLGVQQSPGRTTYDPVRHAVYSWGDGNQMWVLSLTEPLEWLPMEIAGSQPYGSYLAYDPVQDRLLAPGWVLDLPPCPAPEIADQPDELTVAAGSFAQLQVDGGGIASRSYYWRRDGVPLADDGHRAGTHSATLSIAPSSAEDSGTYDVVVREACGTTVSDAAELTVLPSTGVETPTLPATLMLEPPSPNPASRSVTISWAQPQRAVVRVSIFDLSGREVAVLVDGEFAAGRHTRTWSVEARDGARPAGLYWVRVSSAGRKVVRKITILD